MCTTASAPFGRITGSLRGKYMGNQLNMLGVWVGGWVFKVTPGEGKVLQTGRQADKQTD